MQSPSIQHSLEMAFRCHQAGNLREAERLYREVLAAQPNHPGALHYLGVVAAQHGRNEIAVELIGRALSIQPKSPEAHHDQGEAFRALGRFDEAIAAYRRAIVLRRAYPEAHHHLGIALGRKGLPDKAIDAFRQAILDKPNYPEAYCNLGVALEQKGKLDDAIVAFDQAVSLNPSYVEAHYNRGHALRVLGQLEEAIASFRRAISLKPDYADAHHHLGVSLALKRQFNEATVAFRRAIALNPGNAEAYSDLGAALRECGQLDEAVASCRQAILLKPNHPEAYNNLGNALKEKHCFDEAIEAYRRAVELDANYSVAYDSLALALMGNGLLDEAISAHRKAVALDPQSPDPHSNLLLTMQYHPGFDPSVVADEHRNWNRRHAEPLRRFARPHLNDRDAARRLRIGYVSADFREHPVGRFLLPLLAHHDKSQFEVFAYAQVTSSDGLTDRLRSFADHWRNIVELRDSDAADLISQDGIDILVDLAGHTGGNRLLIFARKPAPVQVTYLGYPGTTGLSAIDYRITDHLSDPVDLTESFHTESLHRLPRTSWCILEPESSAPVEPPPVERQSYVTFGSFNNFAKINEAMLRTWSAILLQTPGSRLMLKTSALGAETVRQRVRQIFSSQRIDTDRLILLGYEPDPTAHFARYGEIDMALDPYPYHGTATTVDALWMGVPVVTLAGRSHVSRVGVSLLSSVGLGDLVAQTREEYIEIATALAADRPRLAQLRAGMRERILRSPLMDAPTFAADIEAAYRQMWLRGGNIAKKNT